MWRSRLLLQVLALERGPRARPPRHHGADRQLRHLRDLAITQFLHFAQQQYFAVLLRQRCDEVRQRALGLVGKRSALRVGRGAHQRRQRRSLFFRQRRRSALLLPGCRGVTVAPDRQQPALHVGTAQAVEGAEGAQKRFLHDIVGICTRRAEPPRKAVGRVQMRQHLRFEPVTFVIHGTRRTTHGRRLRKRGFYSRRRLKCQAGVPARRLAASTALERSMAMVMGPKPPGTGVIQAARVAAAANSTSPTSLPSALRLIPTSNTAAPGRTPSPGMKPALPTAATSTSARSTSARRSRVPVWHTVTVARASSSSSAIGRPTMLEAPTTVARAPVRAMPYSCARRMTPNGVHGRSRGRFWASSPVLTG